VNNLQPTTVGIILSSSIVNGSQIYQESEESLYGKHECILHDDEDNEVSEMLEERNNQTMRVHSVFRHNNTVHTIRAINSSDFSLNVSKVPKKRDKKPQKTVFKAADEYRNP
jgi:hypothetical protein